eukprot:NODE_59_length_28102_cov_0.971110.p18 type:complete len:197 gc:universal NODE_59_length_28102_cov_0.971110:26154-25564(-)
MSIQVHRLQEQNPILKHILQVQYNFVDDITIDFIPNNHTGVYFLSIQYHRLHPEFIEKKLKEFQPHKLKILLVQLDVQDYSATLKELYLLTIQHNFRLMFGADIMECANVLESFSIFANKGEEFILPKSNYDYLEQVQKTLTSIKGVNKSDALTLITKFKSIKNFSKATKEDLIDCPGIADTKMKRIFAILNSKIK